MITGKKINELNSIIDPTLETVIPAVKIEGSTISDTAGKLTIQDLKTLSQQGVVKNPNIVTDLTSTTISIDNLLPNTIYQYNTLSSLTISNFIVSYELSSIYFKTSNSSFNLTFTNQPIWIDGSQPTFELNKEYILNIKNGIVWVQGIKVDSAISVIDINSFPATLSTNTNYTATLSGSAAFTLPTPTDTMVENVINILLTVSVNSTVDWGVNANSVLSSFTVGKYEIRLRYNNSTSNWVGEVLKEDEASSSVRLLVRFNGDMSDESANPITLTPSRIVASFPVYAEGQYDTQKLTCTGNSIDNYVTASGDNLSKLNLGTGDFTIMCWLTLSAGYDHPVRIFYKNDSNQISLGYNRIRILIGGNFLLNQGFSGLNMGDTAYITLTRQNGVLYFFVNGTLVTFQASAEAWNLSDWTQIFKGSDVKGVGHYGIQELIVKNTCDYVSDFTVPTTPYVLTDSSLADLHDDTKQNDLTTIKGFNASATQTLKNINGVIQWVTD